MSIKFIFMLFLMQFTQETTLCNCIECSVREMYEKGVENTGILIIKTVYITVANSKL